MVVVCEPGTTGLNDCPPPEHWSWYSVITPSACSGRPHLNVMDVDDDPNLVGGDFGSTGQKECVVSWEL